MKDQYLLTLIIKFACMYINQFSIYRKHVKEKYQHYRVEHIVMNLTQLEPSKTEKGQLLTSETSWFGF